MAVPAHDSRDFEFASAFHLPIIPVVSPSDPQPGNGAAAAAAAAASGSEEGGADLSEAFTGSGVSVNSSSAASGLSLDGLPTKEAAAAVVDWLEAHGCGSRKVRLGCD